MTEAPVAAVRDVVLGMWQAISRRDWNALTQYIAEDCVYVDVPVPMLAARGADDVVTMLRLLLEPLAGYEHAGELVVCDGSDVIYEHSETWTFPTGERGTRTLVSVHKVIDGRVTACRNYWDAATFMSFAPPAYCEAFGTGDPALAFDATVLI